MKKTNIQAQIAAAQKEVNNWPPSIKSATKINSYSLNISHYEDSEVKKKNDDKHASPAVLAL